MAIKRLILVGSESSCLSDEERKLLSDLMAHILYHELDRASALLLVLDQETLIDLEIAADKLIALCNVVRERPEKKQIDTILNMFTRLSNEEIERIREEWF